MPKTLFVVDDSATMRKVFELTFAGEDVTVVTHDGSDGAAARARELRPHAVIVDVNLGGVSGYDLVRSLRAEAGLSGVPIYLLYSDHSPLEEAQARGCGASGAMSKPFDTQALIDRIRQAFSAAATAPAAAGVPAAASPTQPFGGAASANAASALRPAEAATRATAQAPIAARSASAVAVAPAPLGTSKAPAVQPTGALRPVATAARPTTTTAAVRPVTSVAKPLEPAPARVAEAPESTEIERGSSESAPHPLPVARAPEPQRPVAKPAESAAAAAVRAASSEVASKVADLGLTPAQVEAVTALTRDVVERVVWEVVPVLAETMIREELRRLTAPG